MSDFTSVCVTLYPWIMLISFGLSCRYFEQNDLADQPEPTEGWTVVTYQQDIEENVESSQWCSIRSLQLIRNLWNLKMETLQTSTISEENLTFSRMQHYTRPCRGLWGFWVCCNESWRNQKGLDNDHKTCIISSNLLMWMDLCWYGTEARAAWFSFDKWYMFFVNLALTFIDKMQDLSIKLFICSITTWVDFVVGQMLMPSPV